MNELKILIGYGESGKSTFAKEVLKNTLLQFDTLPVYGTEEEWIISMKSIASECNKRKNEEIVLDGYLVLCEDGRIKEPDFKTLKENLKYHTIKPIIIIRKAEDIVNSIKERNPPCNPDNVNRRFICKTYFDIFKQFNKLPVEYYYANNELFTKLDHSNDAYEKITGNNWSECEEFKNYMENINEEKLNNTNYDSKYQDIELPFQYLNGYAGYADGTWNGIQDLVDWKDKTVADMGCLNGHYSFKIADKRAEKVVGYDLFQQACDTCNKIAKINCFENTEFRKLDAGIEEIPEEYDVILLLNMLHHISTPKFLLEQAFTKGKNVIMEVQFSGFSPSIQQDGGAERMIKNTKNWDKYTIMALANKYGHQLVKENRSVKPHRIILHFKKDE